MSGCMPPARPGRWTRPALVTRSPRVTCSVGNTRPGGGRPGGRADGSDALMITPTITPQLPGEVAAALAAGEPAVALETTLVSHGFSEGRGLAAAQAAEARGRAAGAIPATGGGLGGAPP